MLVPFHCDRWYLFFWANYRMWSTGPRLQFSLLYFLKETCTNCGEWTYGGDLVSVNLGALTWMHTDLVKGVWTFLMFGQTKLSVNLVVVVLPGYDKLCNWIFVVIELTIHMVWFSRCLCRKISLWHPERGFCSLSDVRPLSSWHSSSLLTCVVACPRWTELCIPGVGASFSFSGTGKQIWVVCGSVKSVKCFPSDVRQRSLSQALYALPVWVLWTNASGWRVPLMCRYTTSLSDAWTIRCPNYRTTE